MARYQEQKCLVSDSQSSRGLSSASSIMTVLLLCAVAEPAFAQDKGGIQDEIVVTAQKRQQRLQDVALAVTALGAENLASLGRQGVTAIANQVPSLQVNQFSPTITVFNIRGVSQVDFADSQESPIAFYSDGVYIGSLGAIAGMTFDLERIEVLRGPQGTLFGRNATGGLIQVTSAKPDDKFSSYLTVTAGSFNQWATEGAVTGPLAPGVRGRLSFTSDYHDGYIKNRIGPDVGQSRFWATRGQLSFDIGSSGELNLKAQFMRNDDEGSAGSFSFAAAAPDADGLGRFIGADEDFFGTCAGCNAVGYKEPDNNPYTGAFNDPNRFDRKYWSLTAHYKQDLGGVTLTSITDFQKLKKNYLEDSDNGPIISVTYNSIQNLYQISQELRLNGEDGPLNWTAGLYGIEIDTKNHYRAALDFADLIGTYDGAMKTQSIAAFGQMEYAFGPAWKLTGGLRYSIDWKDTHFVNASNGMVDFIFDKSTYGSLTKRRDADYSGKIELSYTPTRNILAYASINRGTKSGGFASPTFAPPDPERVPFEPEVLTNYEVGAKWTFLGGTSHLNMSAFYYDYKDYQSFTIIPPANLTIVNKNATIKGFEAEFNTRAVDGVLLQLFASVLDARVKDIALTSGRIVDRKMPQAPSFSAGGLLRYEMSVGQGALALQTDWKYSGVQYFSAFNAPVDREWARIIGNARISYVPERSGWELALFVNNVTDKAYRIANIDGSSFLGQTQQTFAPPRWIGGSLTWNIR